MRSKALLVGVVVLALPACGDVADGADGEDRELELNGSRLNGSRLNSSRLNGFELNGSLLGDEGTGDVIEMSAFNLPTAAVAVSAWLEGSELKVLTDGGVVLGGADLEKTRLDFSIKETGKHKKKQVRISKVQRLAPGSDVWLYDLDLKDGGGPWESLCVTSQGQATQAILLADAWSPATGARVAEEEGVVTFACRDAALGKCVEWGYWPWALDGDVPLREYHQACTRLVRADYCGDAISHTVDGTPVHVVDPLGIQLVDPFAEYVVEAEWGPEGATCVNPDNLRLGPLTLECELPLCGGDSFSSGGIVQSGKVVNAAQLQSP